MKKILIIILGILLVLTIGLVGFYYYNLYRPVSKVSQERYFEVTDGQGTWQIALDLQDKKLIRSARVFFIYSKLKKIILLPGIYYLSENINLKEIAETISEGRVQENKITTIEGWRREEIAQYLEDKKIVGKDDFLRASEGKEGYLFPDTYRLAVGSQSSEIVEKMVDNWQKRTQGLAVNSQTVILASIVEREAKFDKDRAKIAGVYQNRLRLGMKLDADPTVQYAKGAWLPLKISDYQTVISAYNTYLNKGLPPGPICNPGLASLRAALNPEASDYYYFFHLKDGTAIYSKTKEDHQENLVKYQSER